jgi:hypothetical protein
MEWRKSRLPFDVFNMLPLVSSDLFENLYYIHEHICWCYVTGIDHFAEVRREQH